MSIKKSVYSLFVVMCVAFIVSFLYPQATTFAKMKTINLKEGEVYKIPLKKYGLSKKCTFVSSKKKIAKVSKKGIIKAQKKGKCVVEALNEKKHVKFKIKVTALAETANKISEHQNVPAVPDLSDIDISERMVGGVTVVGQGEILKIEKMDEQYSLVIFENKDNFILGYTEKQYADKKYVLVKIKTSDISEGIGVGDKASVTLFQLRAASKDDFVIFEGTAMVRSGN